jgi:hypothetical protein
MAIICARLRRIKDNPASIVDASAVRRACRRLGHRWRRRQLSPCATLRAFVAQIAAGNTAITDLVRIMGSRFSASAYCQARQRLPVGAVKAALDAFTAKLRKGRSDRSGLWRGHRTALIDRTGVVMPDTPELRRVFGTAAQYQPGCGLPLAHLVTLFDSGNGLLLGMSVAPARSQDLLHAHELHPALGRGDILIGDRALCAYTHLALLAAAGLHGLFRVSSCRSIPFPADNGPRRRLGYNRHHAHQPVLIQRNGRDDQLIEIVKPSNRPKHMSPEVFASVPATMLVRAVRFRTNRPGARSREFVLLTTLLDADRYPAAALAELYLSRWRVEQNIRHLKRTLGMERLKCQSLEGVQRELAVFALVYNAVCAVRALAAGAQGVEPLQISFVDTLRWLRWSSGDRPRIVTCPRDTILLLPKRPPRFHPRQRKRSDGPFPVMHRPRNQLIRDLLVGWAEN